MEENKMNNNINQPEQNNKKTNNERKGRGLFYFVIAIAIIVIAIVGATYAYFTATARTDAENTVSAGSTKISLGIETDKSGIHKNIIPVNDTVAKYAYAEQTTIDYTEECATFKPDLEGNPTDECLTYKKTANSTCIDDTGTEVCSTYSYTVINQNSSDQTLTMYLGTNTNSFANLWFAVYTDTPVLDASGSPVLEDGEIQTKRTRVSDPMPVPAIGEKAEIVPITVDGDEEQTEYFRGLAHPTLTAQQPRKTYTIVLWIHELQGNDDPRNVYDSTKEDRFDQTEIDGNASYEGYVEVISGNGTGVTGVISAVESTNWDDTPVARPTTPTTSEPTTEEPTTSEPTTEDPETGE